MNDTRAPTIDAVVPEERPCTRCDGTQHLVAEHRGFGKFHCDTCEMVVGFDLESEPPEFLIHRGTPGRYTKDWFGADLSAQERRLTTVASRN